MKIKLTTDSTCDLSAELLSRFEVGGVIPMTIIFGDDSRIDGKFEPEEIYEFYKNTKILPTTSAINPFEFKEFFKEQTADGSAVVHFSLSGKMSASCENARLAADGFENVYIVDGKQVSVGTSMLIYRARDILKNTPEMSAKDLAVIMNGMTDKVNTSYCLETITYLYKGGRCSALGLLGANLFDIHPCIHVRNGENAVERKYRGKMPTVIPQYIEDIRKDNPEYDDALCFMVYSPGTDADIVEKAQELTKKLFNFKEILVLPVGATMTCHCGKGTLGLAFMSK